MGIQLSDIYVGNMLTLHKLSVSKRYMKLFRISFMDKANHLYVVGDLVERKGKVGMVEVEVLCIVYALLQTRDKA